MPESDIFGPYAPPGSTGATSSTPGTASTTTATDPGPTTPAIVDGVPFWDTSTGAYVQVTDPGPWNRCTLGKHQLPGFVTVSGSGAERKIDVKDGAGKSGATVTVKGWSPASLTITLILWTPEHLRTWREIRDDLKGKDGSSDPVDIQNPVAEDAGIRSVIVKRIGLLDDAGKGMRKVAIEVLEWVAKPKATGSGTPGTAKGGKGSTDQDAIYRAYQLYITYAEQQKAWGASTWKTWTEFASGVMNPVPPPPPGYPQYAPPPAPTTKLAGG